MANQRESCLDWIPVAKAIQESVHRATKNYGTSAVYRAISLADAEGDSEPARGLGLHFNQPAEQKLALTVAYQQLSQEEQRRVDYHGTPDIPVSHEGYPGVIVRPREDGDLEEIEELAPVMTIEEAKLEATRRGYSVLPDREGGHSLTTDTWRRDRTIVHVVTVR